MPPFEEGGTYCFVQVGWYVGIPQTCATSNWRMLNHMNFKLGKLININMKITVYSFEFAQSYFRPIWIQD